MKWSMGKINYKNEENIIKYERVDLFSFIQYSVYMYNEFMDTWQEGKLYMDGKIDCVKIQKNQIHKKW